jgi:hypothetical protein
LQKDPEAKQLRYVDFDENNGTELLRVGGYSAPIEIHTTTTPPTAYFPLIMIITTVFVATTRKTSRKRR